MEQVLASLHAEKMTCSVTDLCQPPGNDALKLERLDTIIALKPCRQRMDSYELMRPWCNIPGGRTCYYSRSCNMYVG